MILSTKILGALAVAGLVAGGGAAFTASGLSFGAGENDKELVGGTVTQTVEGATVESIVYGFADPGVNTQTNKVTVTFGGTLGELTGRAVTAQETGGTWNAAADGFVCTAINVSGVSECTPVLGVTAGPTGYYTSIDSLAVTVAGDVVA